MSLRPTLSIIGHVCHDVNNDGHRLGGSASFASLLARSLGYQPEVTTSFGDDFSYHTLFIEHGIKLHNQKGGKTTVFLNHNQDEQREQHIKARANSINLDPTFVNDFDIIFLCPIADEIDITQIEFKQDSLVVALLQGWMRDCRKLGKVVPKELDHKILSLIDIAICSEVDLNQISENYLEFIRQNHNHLVVTHGSKGVTIYKNGLPSFFPSYPTKLIDSTGAGDIFGMAYTLSYQKIKDIGAAASFAHAAASLSIEGLGTLAIPSIEEIQVRQELYQNRYL